MKLAYVARYIEDEGTILVHFPDVEGAHSFGSSREEAEKQASDALVTALARYAIIDKEFPKPKTRGNEDDVINVSILDTAKLHLLREVKRRGMTQDDLGKLMGYTSSSTQASGQRLLNFNHRSKIHDIERALELLDVTVSLDLVA